MNLSNTQLFQGLQEQEITLLLDCLNAVKRSYKKGETILSEGNITMPDSTIPMFSVMIFGEITAS